MARWIVGDPAAISAVYWPPTPFGWSINKAAASVGLPPNICWPLHQIEPSIKFLLREGHRPGQLTITPHQHSRFAQTAAPPHPQINGRSPTTRPERPRSTDQS